MNTVKELVLVMGVKCCECGQYATNRDELMRHITVDHVGWTPYQCVYCIDVFLPTEASARTHCAANHRGKSVKVVYFNSTVFEQCSVKVEMLFQFTFNTNDKRQSELKQLVDKSVNKCPSAPVYHITTPSVTQPQIVQIADNDEQQTQPETTTAAASKKHQNTLEASQMGKSPVPCFTSTPAFQVCSDTCSLKNILIEKLFDFSLYHFYTRKV